jgi:ribosomal protein S18 acetylase RimI-like enzyme
LKELKEPLVIRRAIQDDVPAILSLLVDDDLGKLREDGSLKPYEIAFETISRDENQFLGVADLNSKLVGCFQITFIPGLSRRGMWRAQIESVRVARALRAQGLGTIMMRWAIARARERGCGLVQLNSDKSRFEAHNFYEALGFKASHEGFKLYVQ